MLLLSYLRSFLLIFFLLKKIEKFSFWEVSLIFSKKIICIFVCQVANPLWCYGNVIQVYITRISKFWLPIGYVYVMVFFCFWYHFKSTYHARTFIPRDNRSISIWFRMLLTLILHIHSPWHKHQIPIGGCLGGGLFIGNLNDVHDWCEFKPLYMRS